MSGRCVVILSSPRSGSSLTARIVNMLGVYLGESQVFTEANQYNPRGYWEHESIVAINNELMSRLGYDYADAGASWTAQPDLADGWETDTALSDIRSKALQLVEREFAGYETWGWKDPRACFTLPFWKTILPALRCIVLVRNPVDTASSIQRMCNCSFERGLFLWALHLEQAFRSIGSEPHHIIDAEAWNGDWRGELGRLAQFLGVARLATDAEVLSSVHGLIDRSLWHHHASLKALRAAGDLFEGRMFSDCDETLALLETEAALGDKVKRELEHADWKKKTALASGDIEQCLPCGSRLVLVDDEALGDDIAGDREVQPFIERNGRYWGHPSDSDMAISEFERMHRRGIDFMVFTWPSFWWLACFPELNDYLRLRFRCVLQNDRLIIFDLRQ